MTATAQQTAVHLTYVIDNWPHLVDMLTTRHGAPWPPAGRMTDQIAALAQADTLATAEDIAELVEAAQWKRAARRTAERADSDPTALGESPAPIRLKILDTMRTVERELVYLTDVLAQEIQRQPMPKAPSHWPPADRELRDILAAEDAADPRRWRYGHTRSATHAAAWLLGRTEKRPGPFLTLGPTQLRRIQTAAARAHEQIEHALDGVRHAQVVDRPCPLCSGTLGMSSGDGEAPLVVCFTCRHEWKLPLAEVA